MLIGLLMSFPIWLVMGLCTISFWLPTAMREWIYYKTGFFCHIGSCHMQLMKGEFSFKDVVLYNSKDFSSADCLNISEMSCHLPWTQFLHRTITIEKMTWNIRSFVSVNEDGKNNLQQFVANFTVCDSDSGELIKSKEKNKRFSKPLMIDQLEINIDGNMGVRYYVGGKLLAYETAMRKRNVFSHVRVNMWSNEWNDWIGDDYITLEKVCKQILTLLPSRN